MPATALLTSEQYLSLPEEFDQHGNRIKDELIAGEIVRMPPPSREHDLIKNRIHEIILLFLHANRDLGLKALMEYAIQIGDRDVLVPDISVFRKERVSGGQGRLQRGAPDLAIEIVSPSDTALHVKAKVDAYLSGGGSAVWVVYPESKSVLVYSRESIREIAADHMIEDPLLAGFVSPVSTFFELD